MDNCDYRTDTLYCAGGKLWSNDPSIRQPIFGDCPDCGGKGVRDIPEPQKLSSAETNDVTLNLSQDIEQILLERIKVISEGEQTYLGTPVELISALTQLFNKRLIEELENIEGGESGELYYSSTPSELVFLPDHISELKKRVN